MSEYIVVPTDRAGLELDEYLCLQFPEVNKGFVRRQVRVGRVLVDGEAARPSQRLRDGQVLIVDFDADEAPLAPVAPALRIPILYEDDDVIVVDKPAGLAVEPERWARDQACLSGALLEMARQRARGDEEAEGSKGEETESVRLEMRPRLVHRIDKGTTGIVLVAKHLEAERALRRAFDEGTVHKEYFALVEGEHPLPDGESELLDMPLGPDDRRSGLQRVVAKGGKPSRTLVRVERRFRGYTLLACEPQTGRTHQIRVHLAAAGFPLAVDHQYGRRDALYLSHIKAGYRVKRGRPERALIDRTTLHAARISVPGIQDEARRIRVEAPLPKDFERTLKQLEKNRAWWS